MDYDALSGKTMTGEWECGERHQEQHKGSQLRGNKNKNKTLEVLPYLGCSFQATLQDSLVTEMVMD